MIPCKGTCPYYTEGCHKYCADWKQYQEQMRLERIKKAAYLKIQEENSRILIRQYREMTQARRFY